MNVRYNAREHLVEDVKTIGQTIIDRAEDIVGDWDKTQEYRITAEISCWQVPQLKWEKCIVTIPIPSKCEVRE